jgi:anti-sigma B factor antagonist
MAGGCRENGYILRPAAAFTRNSRLATIANSFQSVCWSILVERETNVALKMTDREVDGVVVVALDGRIVLGEETNAFREKIKALLAEGKKKILLNLDNITLIDSTGLGTLVSAHHSAASRGASLRLCKLGTKFQEVLQVTKLLTVFDVSDTEADGVRSFAK